jgi:hypothetical protein
MRSALEVVFVVLEPLVKVTPNVSVLAVIRCEPKILLGFGFAIKVVTVPDAIYDDYPFA